MEERPPAYDQDKYFVHLLDQYKMYVDIVDRISARRVMVNNTFITLIGAGAVAYSAAPQYLKSGATFFQLGITLACILIAILWKETILYYQYLSQAKFQVIHELEDLLPAQPFKIEYAYLEKLRDARKRHPFSKSLVQMEMYLPYVAIFISACAFLLTLVQWWRAGA